MYLMHVLDNFSGFLSHLPDIKIAVIACSALNQNFLIDSEFG